MASAPAGDEVCPDVVDVAHSAPVPVSMEDGEKVLLSVEEDLMELDDKVLAVPMEEDLIELKAKVLLPPEDKQAAEALVHLASLPLEVFIFVRGNLCVVVSIHEGTCEPGSNCT
jgi:hypothetical protein